jgi:8-oxo-dGTP pyrophosphatase MutT (NUDIX family)
MTTIEQQIELVRRALAYSSPISSDELLLPYDRDGMLTRRMSPEPGVTPRNAAALLLFYPCRDELWFPLTVRSSRLPMHRGEVSLPGGAIDPEDAGPTAAALRETHEEVGIDPSLIEVWGMLRSLYIPPSNFYLTPVVGFIAALPPLVPNPGEIADIFCAPLRLLLDTRTIEVEEWDLHGLRTNVPFFAISGHKVWGATAIVLSELVARIRKVSSDAKTKTGN